ncbi:MAG TPA: CDP-diacylglycerol--serine O-phosphatidyltransferase [Stellaceae bacterium]|nr:CDP-diacylglycerol--serine O-phosphatidyltransferase [Stellaceae bacterium]
MKRPLRSGMRLRVRAPRQRPAISSLSFNKILPNLITLLALCAGMTAIRYGLDGKFEAGVAAIMVAGALDGLDGRVARLLKASSSFGAELDSLSDFVCFGVAPALLLFIWTMQSIGAIGWAAALLLGVCAALRLARFNTQLGIPDPPPYAYNFFTGVPAPAAAALAVLPMCAAFVFGDTVFRSPWLCVVTTVLTAGLMVSRIPTFSGKKLRVPPEYLAPLLIGAAVLTAFLLATPFATLLVMGLVYLASIPFSIRSYRKLEKAAEELRASRAMPDAPLLRAVETLPGLEE